MKSAPPIAAEAQPMTGSTSSASELVARSTSRAIEVSSWHIATHSEFRRAGEHLDFMPFLVDRMFAQVGVQVFIEPMKGAQPQAFR